MFNFLYRGDVMKIMVKVLCLLCLIGCILVYPQNAVAQESENTLRAFNPV